MDLKWSIVSLRSMLEYAEMMKSYAVTPGEKQLWMEQIVNINKRMER